MHNKIPVCPIFYLLKGDYTYHGSLGLRYNRGLGFRLQVEEAQGFGAYSLGSRDQGLGFRV